MELKGSIEHIIFRNSDNGYTVVVVDTGSEFVTASGNFSSVNEGENVEMEGDYKPTKYGMQFFCTACKQSPPSSEDAIIRYLASGLIKGVGEATATAIVERFGEATLEIIEKNPLQLKEIKGISAKKAAEIANSYLAIKDLQKTVMFLQGLGFSINMALKIYDCYGDRTQELIVRNPYRMIEDIDGIGFATADKAAEKMGIQPESDFRMRAAIIYILKDAASSGGSTYLPAELLKQRLDLLLNTKSDIAVVEEIVSGLAIDMQVRIYLKGEERCVCLYKMYQTERNIAKRVIEIQRDYTDIHINIEDDIREYEKIHAIALHEGQKAAVRTAVNSGVAVITGGPGTGKTTIVNCILTILKARGYSVELAAPTGRAAKRLSETTGEDAKTIHRLLDLDFKDGQGYFTYNENTRLDADVIIVDESSMVDAYLMNSLIRAVRTGSRLILVGDKDQLPSVGAGNVLSDIIASGIVPVVMLTEIYRQDSDSLIIVNAHRINQGLMPIINNNKRDFFFQNEENAGNVAEIAIEMVTKRIPAFTGEESAKIQILCPMKKGVNGSVAINERLQNILNPEEKGKEECTVEGSVFRAGDKIMQMSNNYKLEWRRGLSEVGTGVYNGDIGRIAAVNKASGEITVTFEDGRTAVYSAVDTLDLSLAYAISIHKSQGSEFDTVVIPVTGGHRALFTRNLLYTAVTRAKKMVVLIGSKKHIKSMIDNDYTEKRYSLLQEFLITLSRELS